MRKILCTFAAATAGLVTLASDVVVWKFPEALAEWNQHFNAIIKETDDAVILIPNKGDHGIINPATDIDPQKYNRMRITYRAKGFKVGVTTGAIFFTTPEKKKFSASCQINLPSLIPDGKLRAISFRLDHPEWQKASAISKIRLDITDQMPGDVEIVKIELFGGVAKLENAVWDFTDGEGAWNTSDKLDVSHENGELKLVTTGIDSHLFNSLDNFDAAKYSKLQITYRASGFTRRTSGGLFYMSSGDKNYTPRKFIKFPSLICDGKEHTFTVNVKMPDDIRALRLDIVDQTPGTVWLKKIEFLP